MGEKRAQSSTSEGRSGGVFRLGAPQHPRTHLVEIENVPTKKRLDNEYSVYPQRSGKLVAHLRTQTGVAE
jgi:hypothetical protein